MLSATVGSLDDVVVGEFDSAPEVASPDFSQEAIGLPSGVSLLVCPVANWSDSGSGQLAPTPAIETNQSIEANGSLSSVIDDSGLLLCTFPPATFSLSGDADFGDSGDSIAPPTVDPGIDGGQDTVVDPTIIVDPVITDPDWIAPPTVDPGVDGGQDTVVDPTIIVDPVITDPDWIAPPTVDPGVDGGQDTVVDPTIIVDPVITDLPTFKPVDIRVQFVSSDAGWAAYYYSVGVDGSVNIWVCASYGEPGIADFVSGDSEARASATVEDTGDGWVVWNFPADLAPPVPETGVFAPTGGVDPIVETFGNPDPTLDDGTDPVLIACDGYPLAREFCTLVVDCTSGNGAELADSGLSVDVSAYSAAIETTPQSPAPVGSPNTVSYSWMAAFAANLPGTGGDSTQPVTVRRRGR